MFSGHFPLCQNYFARILLGKCLPLLKYLLFIKTGCMQGALVLRHHKLAERDCKAHQIFSRRREDKSLNPGSSVTDKFHSESWQVQQSIHELCPWVMEAIPPTFSRGLCISPANLKGMNSATLSWFSFFQNVGSLFFIW